MTEKENDDESRYWTLFEKWFNRVLAESFKEIEKAKEKPGFQEIIARFENRYYFFIGLGSGLLFGLLGNLLVTHWIELLRMIVNEEMWSLVNMIAFVFAFIGLTYFGYWIYGRMNEEKGILTSVWLERINEALKSVHVEMPEELAELFEKRRRKMRGLLFETQEQENRNAKDNIG